MNNLEAIRGVHVLVHATAGPESNLHIPTTKLIQRIVENGATAIQIRDKDEVPDDVLVDLGVQVMPMIRDTGGILMVNDRHSVALAIRDKVEGPIGVHLGQGDKLLEEGRVIVKEEMILGASANTPFEVERVKAANPDYWAVHLFESPKRPTGLAVGLEGAQQVKDTVYEPVLGIGSVTLRNASQVMEVVDGLAVIRAVLDAPDPAMATRQLARIVYQAKQARVPG